jgi:predicted membrane chloride channel (bestrophin family)
LLRSLTLWLFTLPFAVVRELGYAMGPVLALASWLLYGICKVGYRIEDSFQGSLRFKALCRAIYRDVLDGTDGFRRRSTSFAEESASDVYAWRTFDEKATPCSLFCKVRCAQEDAKN